MEINGKQENPYLAFSPCCGQTICLQCVRFDEQSNRERCGCERCGREIISLRYRRKKHLATYDHSTVDISERVVLRMTIDDPARSVVGWEVR